MLYFNFNRIFKIRGIDKPSTFLVRNGISESFATKIIRGDHRKMNLDSIEKLCIIFKCTPNDFLQWIPDNKNENIAGHPLEPLHRTDKVASITATLNSVPLDRLIEIEKIILSEIGKGSVEG